MMAIGLGKLEEFNPEADTIASYVERVELYFEANGVADAKKVAVFLNAIGMKTYSLLRDLLAYEAPREVPFEALGC